MAQKPEATDSNAGPNLKSERAIHDELLAARKRPQGLSPQMMAQCPVMCDVLGNGDPEVAHVQLSLKLLEIIEAEDDVLALEAACYSLALTTGSSTHLRRLEEFGDRHYIDQRQARRHSDRGLRQLARLIASNWTTQTVPEARITLIGTGPSSAGFTVQVRCQRHVDMQTPQVWIGTTIDTASAPVLVTWHRTSEADAVWTEDEFERPYAITLGEYTTIRLVWHGEVWPKFTVVLAGECDVDIVTTESLGSACAVSLSSN